MIDILINGYDKNFKNILEKTILEDKKLNLIGSLDKSHNLAEQIEMKQPHVILDFTDNSYTMKNIRLIISYNIHPIIRTKNISFKELNIITKICRIKKLGCLITPDFSIANNLLVKYVNECNKYFKHFPRINELRKKERKSYTQLYNKKQTLGKTYCKQFPSKKEVVFSGISENLVFKSINKNCSSLTPGIRFACNSVKHLNGLIYGLDKII